MLLGKTWFERKEALHNKHDYKYWEKYAFLPTKLNDGSYVWLEKYYRHSYVIHDNMFKFNCTNPHPLYSRK